MRVGGHEWCWCHIDELVDVLITLLLQFFAKTRVYESLRIIKACQEYLRSVASNVVF